MVGVPPGLTRPSTSFVRPSRYTYRIVVGICTGYILSYIRLYTHIRLYRWYLYRYCIRRNYNVAV